MDLSDLEVDTQEEWSEEYLTLEQTKGYKVAEESKEEEIKDVNCEEDQRGERDINTRE